MQADGLVRGFTVRQQRSSRWAGPCAPAAEHPRETGQSWGRALLRGGTGGKGEGGTGESGEEGRGRGGERWRGRGGESRCVSLECPALNMRKGKRGVMIMRHGTSGIRMCTPLILCLHCTAAPPFPFPVPPLPYPSHSTPCPPSHTPAGRMTSSPFLKQRWRSGQRRKLPRKQPSR